MKGLFLTLLFLLTLFPVTGEVIVAVPKQVHRYNSIVWYPNEKVQDTSPEKPTREELLLLQVYLDELNFGPGVLDGWMGAFSQKALEAYYTTLGRPDEKSPGLAIEHAFKHKNFPYVMVTVPELASNYITSDLPTKYEEMATHKRSNYRSYKEFIAERYHTSLRFLAKINGQKHLDNLRVGSEVVVPNVRPFLIETLESQWFKSEDWMEANYAVINTKEKHLKIFRKESENDSARLIAFFPITPGRKDQIKYGDWRIKNAVTYPNWRYDPLVLKGTGRSKEKDVVHVPPGPNNPVGILWNGLTAKSVGIHGTNEPSRIGRAESSGCIRMSNWDVIKIPNFLRPGCKVTIL